MCECEGGGGCAGRGRQRLPFHPPPRRSPAARTPFSSAGTQCLTRRSPWAPTWASAREGESERGKRGASEHRKPPLAPSQRRPCAPPPLALQRAAAAEMRRMRREHQAEALREARKRKEQVKAVVAQVGGMVASALCWCASRRASCRPPHIPLTPPSLPPVLPALPSAGAALQPPGHADRPAGGA